MTTQASEARVVCGDLLTLHRADNADSPAAIKRDADAQYLARSLCYDVDTALYKPANTP